MHLLVRRACDWPPGGGMPNAAFDEEHKHLPLRVACSVPTKTEYPTMASPPRAHASVSSVTLCRGPMGQALARHSVWFEVTRRLW